MKNRNGGARRAAHGAATAAPVAAPKPTIDYPTESETLPAAGYTIRVAAPGARMVRVAINQGDWRDCRPSVGYWWYDWSGYADGEHELVACAEYDDGREIVSAPAHCQAVASS